jgi:hypothetical protein
MARNIPAQTRAVDPYASYNSNIVNQLTGIVTRGSNALDYENSLQVIADSTSSTDHVEVLTGIIYKDDMLIEITSPFRVDFTNPSHYVSASENSFKTDPGIYYIVLEYTYAKSRPAPQAYIKILLPSQRATYASGGFPSLFFLKAVEVSVSGGVGQIDALYDYDPDNTDVKREYLKSYVGTEVILPTFDQERDQSRVVYNPEEDEFYFGYSDRWGSAGGGTTLQADTSGFELGDLVYVTPSNTLAKAIGPFGYSTADGAVVKVSTKGFVAVGGRIENVKVETGQTITPGRLLYLSTITPGAVSTTKSSPTWQFVGRSQDVIDGTSINILFVRGEPNGTEGVEYGVPSVATLPGGSWTPSGSLEYQDFDISGFEQDKVITTIWDTSTGYKLEPTDIEFVSDSIMRIWMPGGYSTSIDCLVIGPAATPAATGSLQKVTDVLSGGDWISSGGSYYGVIDTSSIELSDGAVVICMNTSNEQVFPDEIQYDSTSVSIWMPVNTETISVIAVGPTASETTVASMTTILASGASWVSDSGEYYQDVIISTLGTDDVVYDVKDTGSLELIHASATIPSSGILRIWMPDNTHELEVTVVG